MSGPSVPSLLWKNIASGAAAAAAADVDRNARFPIEAINEAKRAKLLGAYVPEELGGLGCSIEDLAAMCNAVGQGCSAAGMVLAMHHIQVACLVHHGLGSPRLRTYLQELAEHQLLIASVTSEVGIGGDMRSSVCSLVSDAHGFTLRKDATTISYGEHADDLLVTCRRTPESAPNDQVLVLVRRADVTLEKTSHWDTLGMRGTCSPGFLLTSRGADDQMVPVAFADVASQTMVPFSHLLWSSVWLGIATDAVTRARTFVREQARRTPGAVPPTASRLAELWSALQTMRAGVHDVLMEYQQLLEEADGLQKTATLAFALRINNVKVGASQQLVDIVQRALLICGIAGYKNDSPFSLGRHLRDAISAPLMVGNDRILATNASLLLVLKGE